MHIAGVLTLNTFIMDVRYLFYSKFYFLRSYLFLGLHSTFSFKIIYMPRQAIYVHSIRLFNVELGITNFPPPI
ncbi:hypothetical protein ULMA_15970 [Patiriisocius marinus]|uniref:Uncharacterized protein n=1 Tax=Patiriisocius marinus TaxID=1397112 RepID=A0A5J4IPC8_9FLAO|nr:hypothetical protein ULMA_15970 [Patiriisocius marinus]